MLPVETTVPVTLCSVAASSACAAIPPSVEARIMKSTKRNRCKGHLRQHELSPPGRAPIGGAAYPVPDLDAPGGRLDPEGAGLEPPGEASRSDREDQVDEEEDE